MAIREGTTGLRGPGYVLSALRHFDLFQILVIRRLWLSWMTDILGSGCGALERYKVAGKVVELFWEQQKLRVLFDRSKEDPSTIPPLLGFLRLGEEVGWGVDTSLPGVLTLRILSWSISSDGSGPTVLPILASVLRPTHHLRSRKTALKAFCQFGSGWLSSQMENVSSVDRAGLLHAVGDPFQSTPDPAPHHELQDQRYAFDDQYNPMDVATILIEFAASDLWRNHLRHSNFVSCEDVIFTAEGGKSAFKYPQQIITPRRFLLLRTPAQIISVIDCLEALRCPRTAEAILTSTWASASIALRPIDLDGWRQIQQKTLAFYQSHGIGRLKVLPQLIMMNTDFFIVAPDAQCRVESVRLPVRVAKYIRRWGSMGNRVCDVRLALVCQRNMLYQLFGCNPMTWEEMFAADSEGVDEGVDVSVGQSGVPGQFIDWICDYP